MSEPKFTPGPWFIDVNTMFDKVFIMCKENLPVNCGFIAEMADTNKNREADTNLIAAAPEMYELLDTIYLKLDMMRPISDSHECTRDEMISDIKALLHKAKGEEKVCI